ncbi:MAG: hypothetical protein Q4C05_08130 [Akkermansia sp.]|nr:hypothetical protein [Akkermansia sp.]
MVNDAVKLPGNMVKQFSVMLQNRVGALNALLGLLDLHGIYCLGFGFHDCHEATIVRLVVSDPEQTSLIFLEKGICYTDSDILVVAMRNGPEELKSCLDVIFSAGMNVNVVYPLMPHERTGDALIALHLDDLDLARRVLNSAGHKLLYQQDLSR